MIENQVVSRRFSYVNNAVLQPSKMKLIKFPFQWINQMFKNQSLSGPYIGWNFQRVSNPWLIRIGSKI